MLCFITDCNIWHLLCLSASADVKVVYETPLRVCAALPRNQSVEFCDYLFPDETLVDSANRFRDLVGIDVDESGIDATVEHVPSELIILMLSFRLRADRCKPSTYIFSGTVPFTIFNDPSCTALPHKLVS